MARPEFEVAIEKVLFMTEDDKKFPDIAFMVVQKHPKCPPPIPLMLAPVTEGQLVSVVGYPAYDPGGITSVSAAKKVFGGIWDVKRCSPGEVDQSPEDAWYFFHDCTTMRGNSGSVVLDNETANAVGLHFMGDVGRENYAVRSAEIAKYLKKIKTKVYLRSAPPKDENRSEGSKARSRGCAEELRRPGGVSARLPGQEALRCSSDDRERQERRGDLRAERSAAVGPQLRALQRGHEQEAKDVLLQRVQHRWFALHAGCQTLRLEARLAARDRAADQG